MKSLIQLLTELAKDQRLRFKLDSPVKTSA